jgi:hypothetical protein
MHGPVVPQRQTPQVTRMQRMDLMQQRLEFLHPVGALLLVQPPLRLLPILHPQELVVAPLLAQALLIHPLGQPFATVQADLDLEGKPRLQPDIHPAKARVQIIVVQR